MKNLLKKCVLSFGILMASFWTLKAQNTLILNSNFLSKPDTSWVFTPENYNSAKSYPLVFMLHGWDANYKQWNKIAGLQQYANDYQFVIVCPDGLNDSWYLNSPEVKNSQFESFFIKELYPKILANYSINVSKIFITGLSMGGHGALTIFFKNLDLFLSAGSTSGVLDMRVCAHRFGIPKLLGEKSARNELRYLDFSAISLVKNMIGKTKPFIFDCGTEDFFFPSNQEFYKVCEGLKIPVNYSSSEGKHDNKYWQKTIRLHMDFFKELAK
ncbi:MAG: esterase [Bacteroidetes bacterium]|nr:MAG: esterase [Bacteroidota bacterium]